MNVCGSMLLIAIIKGTVYPQMEMCWKLTHTQAIQDGYFLMGTNLEKCIVTSLVHQ